MLTPGHELSAKADIAGSLPRIHSPGAETGPSSARSPTPAGGTPHRCTSSARARSVGEGRHRGFIAANSFAGGGDPASSARSPTPAGGTPHRCTSSARARSVGEGRHRGFVAANSFAGGGDRASSARSPTPAGGPRTGAHPPPVHDLSAKADIAGSLPRIHSPGAETGPPPHDLRLRLAVPRTGAHPPPVHDLSAKADIAGSLPRIHSPGAETRPPPHDLRLRLAVPRTGAQAPPVHDLSAKADIAGSLPRIHSPGAETRPPPHDLRLRLAVPRTGAHPPPCTTCRRRPTSRGHCREFIRRGRRPGLLRTISDSGWRYPAPVHILRPRTSRRRRPTSRGHCREFIRRAGPARAHPPRRSRALSDQPCVSRTSADPPARDKAGLTQSSREAEQQSSRAAEQQRSRAAEQQSSREARGAENEPLCYPASLRDG